MVMLPDNLKEKYKVTAKVTAPIFRNAILGVVNLRKIGEPMAEKLVKKGYLVKVVEPDKPLEGPVKKKVKE